MRCHLATVLDIAEETSVPSPCWRAAWAPGFVLELDGATGVRLCAGLCC